VVGVSVSGEGFINRIGIARFKSCIQKKRGALPKSFLPFHISPDTLMDPSVVISCFVSVHNKFTSPRF